MGIKVFVVRSWLFLTSVMLKKGMNTIIERKDLEIKKEKTGRVLPDFLEL